MHISDYGKGPAVLLLHGSPTAARYFDPLVEALAGRFRVLVPEFPGYGRSPMLSPGAPFTASQAQLVGDLEALGVREAAVVGFSLGAYRALDLAVSGRLKVRSIVTMGGFMNLTPDHRAGLKALAEQIRPMRSFDEEFRRTIAGLMLAPENAAAHPEWVREVGAWLDVVSPRALADEFLASTLVQDLTAQVRSLDVPITARVGEQDAATPPVYSEELVRTAPRATLQQVPGCGHALLIEDRGPTLEAVAQALAVG